MMVRKFDAGVPAHVRVHDAFTALGREIAMLSPDVLIVVGSEHLNTFTYDCLPQICIGIGDSATGWGDAGVASATVPIASAVAERVLTGAIAHGFDAAWSANPRLDHGFMTPLTLLRPRMDIPIVPVFVNASTEPLGPVSRCWSFGEMLGRVLASDTVAARVVILATGGLSHWVGTPQMGEINVAFDHAFLDAMEAGDMSAMITMPSDELTAQAGNGGQEVRNWLAAIAARPGPGATLAYEPVSEWATGIALARLHPNRLP
jgi:protocatechuate 4,5-dioxygenase beta chain/2'-carboxy-2,3-dihydroxybiphenyl 1,2-dioxygenase large subunit/2'-aminobiphenyl-2,3-diol 1,2-dioxygenase large subunit